MRRKGEIAVVNAAFDARCVVFGYTFSKCTRWSRICKKKKNALALSSDFRLFKGIIATRPSVADSYGWWYIYLKSGRYGRRRRRVISTSILIVSLQIIWFLHPRLSYRPSINAWHVCKMVPALKQTRSTLFIHKKPAWAPEWQRGALSCWNGGSPVSCR